MLCAGVEVNQHENNIRPRGKLKHIRLIGHFDSIRREMPCPQAREVVFVDVERSRFRSGVDELCWLEGCKKACQALGNIAETHEADGFATKARAPETGWCPRLFGPIALLD